MNHLQKIVSGFQFSRQKDIRFRGISANHNACINLKWLAHLTTKQLTFGFISGMISLPRVISLISFLKAMLISAFLDPLSHTAAFLCCNFDTKPDFSEFNNCNPFPRKSLYISSFGLVRVSGCRKNKQEVDFDLLCLWVPRTDKSCNQMVWLLLIKNGHQKGDRCKLNYYFGKQ